MTVLSRIVQAMRYGPGLDPDPDYIDLARTAIETLRDEFADPVVRAAIQSVLDGE